MSADGVSRLPADQSAERMLTAEAVREYIRKNPSLVSGDPELLAQIVPDTGSDDGVVADMQRFAIERLKQHIADLTRQRDATLQTIRANNVAQAKAHNAALAILEARNFEHMVQVITREIGPMINVDRVVLCVEEPDGTTNDFAAVEKLGVRILPECAVDAFLGEGVMSLLKADTHGSALLFGSTARDVRSYALIRMAVSPVAPPGLLVLASHAPDTFDARQGVDLLDFLARVIERQVRAWLGLPAA